MTRRRDPLIAGLLVAALLLVGCATAPPNPTRDGATLVTDTACFSSPDPTGVVTVALCGAAVVHHGVWWLLDRRSTAAPATVSERVRCSTPEGFHALRTDGPALEVCP